MGNHFHLLLETPEANLAAGMRLLLGTFSQGWNRRRLRRGWVAWLEARASNEGGMIGDEATKALRKGDGGKVQLAALLRRKATVGNGWIAKRLRMGHHESVSRL